MGGRGILLGETEPERNNKCQVDITVEVCLNGAKGNKNQKKVCVLNVRSEA